MVDKPGLMPCPFCGNLDLEYYVGTKTLGAVISCECGCAFDGTLAAWNTRATPPAAVVEAMERALRVFTHSYTFQTDGIISAFYDAETALAALTAWRAEK